MAEIKTLLSIFIFFVSTQAQTQVMPTFLQGTWKMENKDIYEHWDILTKDHMKGVSYTLNNKHVTIFEYLDITKQYEKTTYTATVPGHNEGKSIKFDLTTSGDSLIFKNPEHDFPQKIVYEKLSDTEIYIHLSGGDRELSYKIIKEVRN